MIDRYQGGQQDEARKGLRRGATGDGPTPALAPTPLEEHQERSSPRGFWGFGNRIWSKYKEGVGPAHVVAGGQLESLCPRQVWEGCGPRRASPSAGVVTSAHKAHTHLITCSLRCQPDCAYLWSQVDASGALVPMCPGPCGSHFWCRILHRSGRPAHGGSPCTDTRRLLLTWAMLLLTLTTVLMKSYSLLIV